VELTGFEPYRVDILLINLIGLTPLCGAGGNRTPDFAVQVRDYPV
jgi:hypothetical protein